MKKIISIVLITAMLMMPFMVKNGCEMQVLGKESLSFQKQYVDVNTTDWFYNDVLCVTDVGLMTGIAEDVFGPNENTNRAMIVTILWRLDGCIQATTTVGFEDVSKDAYYYNAVAWATQKEIVNGYSENIFAPDDNATREQLLTILYRYSEYKKYDTSNNAQLDNYEDEGDISRYATEPFEWGVANGIITGMSKSVLAPKELVKRCQVAAILNRFCDGYVLDEAVDTQTDNTSNTNPDTSNKGNNGGSGYFDSKPIQKPDADNEETDTSNEELTTNLMVLTVDSIIAQPGDMVMMKVKLDNNPGVLGMVFSVFYDENCCELTEVTNGDAFGDILDMTTSKNLDSGTRFVWDGVDLADENVKDGTILTMKFKIADSAKNGKYPIIIKFSDGDIIGRNLEKLWPVVQNGYITIDG